MTDEQRQGEGVPAGAVVAVDLVTDDPDRARQFYGALLGWGFTPGAGTDETLCVMGDQVAASILPASAAPVLGWRTTFLVDDPDLTAERVVAAGGTVAPDGTGPTTGTGGPTAGRDTGWAARAGGAADAAGVRHATDPLGAPFAVTAAPSRPPVRPGPGLPSWFELMTPDPEGSDAFYSAVLGHEVAVQGDPGMGFALYTVGGRPVTGRLLLPAPLAAGGPRWMTYVAVPDVDLAADGAAGLGGEVLVPPVDTPVGRVCAVRDPGGAVLTLLRPAG